jgi:hypothetical protein
MGMNESFLVLCAGHPVFKKEQEALLFEKRSKNFLKTHVRGG